MAELAALAAAAGSAVAGSASTILPIIGTAATVAGTIGAGYAQKQEAEFTAEQQKRAGTEELAIATREAEDRRRKTAYVLSEQKAKAASSGGGVTNPTILDIMGETAQEGDYLARSDLASGKNKAAGLFDKAAASKYRGKAAFTGAILEGIGAGAEGMYKAKYGRTKFG